MLTRYGFDVVRTVVISVILIGIVAAFIPLAALRGGIWGLEILFLAFTFYFFRDPERRVPDGARGGGSVVSPGDGKVVQIIPVDNPPFVGGKATQVSVFLSPLNVHVNRIPITGVVKFFKYVRGEYIVAFHEKASEKNERTEIGIEAPAGRVLFKQIAGYVARRIVCPLKEGDKVTIGERFGMIKFGSRVDIIVSDTAKIIVKVGDKVVGGETIVAQL